MIVRTRLLALALLAGCAPSVPVIAVDVDQCHFCRMIISDARHAAAAIDAGGRTVRFDSIECLAGWVAASDQPPRQVWVTDAGATALIPAGEAAFRRDPAGSPMAGGWMAERREAAAPGAIDWDSLQAVVAAEGMPAPGLPAGVAP